GARRGQPLASRWLGLERGGRRGREEGAVVDPGVVVGSLGRRSGLDLGRRRLEHGWRNDVFFRRLRRRGRRSRERSSGRRQRTWRWSGGRLLLELHATTETELIVVLVLFSAVLTLDHTIPPRGIRISFPPGCPLSGPVVRSNG